MTISPSGRYIAYCERAEPRAQVTVYDLASRKKRKTLPEPDMENLSIECREFLGCAFSPTTEQQHLVTLSGEPDWCAILWQWDQFKMLAKVDLNIVDPVEPLTFQISLAQIMSDMVCVVTGSQTYKYIKLEENFRSFRLLHTQLFPHGRDDIS